MLTTVPRKDLEWLVRSMASHFEMDPAQIARMVEKLSGFNREYQGHNRSGLMSVQKAYVKRFKLNQKHMREWRDNVGLGFQILKELRLHFQGDMEKAIAAYTTSIEDVEVAVKKNPRYWRDELTKDARIMLGYVEKGEALVA